PRTTPRERGTGADAARTYTRALLGGGPAGGGAAAEGLAVLTECWPWMDKTGGRVFEAELYRIRGELTLQKQPGVRGPGSGGKIRSGSKVQSPKSREAESRPFDPDPAGEAEAYFLRALDTARRQQAKSLELRAGMSLVRLRQQQATHASRDVQHVSRDRLDEAHKLLSAAYHWFTEGFETQDLRDAKALLDTPA